MSQILIVDDDPTARQTYLGGQVSDIVVENAIHRHPRRIAARFPNRRPESK